MGSTDIYTLGKFTADVTVDGLTFTLNFDVVPDHYSGHDLILGGELSDFAEIRIHRRRATLIKFEEAPTMTCKADDID